ncbi:LamB/YcsF family protein [Chitinophaga sp. G-6-1-13]|uniref:LamB/YcsF family protein n=1 Tax=Chitinophaga fulva TaxID=2728842 RepID=A0A848GNC1_9BACT|nr:5-oxoprolinase subunit PxpA [Chitinophaga fulva]NML38170.1 LamB/YcsF family protein [Chitinophaga fulva]
MNYIDLNCDMGEGLDNDAAIMPFISSANIACGYHAGNADIMNKTVLLATEHKVAIGAHPGFADREHFGRREQQLTDPALYDLVCAQIYALQTICRVHGVPLHHVKPHGALYNMAARIPAMAQIIAKAVKDVDSRLRLFGLSNSLLISAAAAAGLKTVSEVFADRTYQDDGSLTARSQPDAMIENETLAVKQVLQMVTRQEVTALSGKIVPLKAETICLHGDGAHALEYARAIHTALLDHHLTIQHP